MLIVSIIVFLLLLLISAGPGFAILFYVSKHDDSNLVKFFVVGFAGWLITQILVYVPSILIQNLFIRSKYDLEQVANDPALKEEVTAFLAHNIYLIMVLAAIFAITEQLIRFYFVSKSESIKHRENVLISFGVGWGLAQTIILYTPDLLSALFNAPQLLNFSGELFLGALEKSFYVILSVFLSVLVKDAITKPQPVLFIEAINWEFFYYFIPFLVAELIFPGKEGIASSLVINLSFLLILILMFYVRKDSFLNVINELKRKTIND